MTQHVHHEIARHAVTRPHAPALGAGGRWRTYRELDAAVRAAAATLSRAAGPRNEAPVVVITARSEWSVIAMLATWWAGGVYVPLAEDTPPQRLETLLTRVGPAALLTDRHHLARLRAAWTHCPVLDVEEAAASGDATFPAAPLDDAGTRLACLVHTSGSSGPAKGVMIEHRALANLMAEVTRSYAPEPGERALHFGAFGWDSSIEEAILPLYSGASLLVRTDEADYGVPHFLRELREQSVNHLYLPTSYWREICLELARDTVTFPTQVRSVLIGGERAAGPDLATWRSRVPGTVDLLNCYGLTETCVTSAIHRDDRAVPADDLTTMPLGRPCPSVTISVRDEQLREVPPGTTGELCVGGPGVARGYWGEPAGTAAAFVPDPGGSGRLYRTGDLARIDASGLLHFVGRVDRQVKVNGFRVNPHEVEAALAAHQDVRKVCVLPRTEPSGLTGLVAYVEPVEDADTSAEELTRHTAKHLPAFMVPATVEIVDAMPLLPSGKIDAASLAQRTAAPEAPGPVDAPTRDEDLTAIWCEVLGVASCTPDDDFLDLGGNSLSGMRIAARINEVYGVEILFRDILERRTVAAVLDRVTELRTARSGHGPGSRSAEG